MRKLLAPLIFLVHTTLQISNLAVWGTLVILFGLIKLAIPVAALRGMIAKLMNVFLFSFGKVSVFLIEVFNDVHIERRINTELSQQDWYLIIANHISYLDIVLLIELAAGRTAAPKFFLKRELIWLPFVGLAAWALDMPFMRRYSQAYIAKYPHKKGKDIETTTRYCLRFKELPTSVINFVEGTRFTWQKHKAKESAYASLLPPKAGGIMFTLATMGKLFSSILDVSLVYPDSERHPMLSVLSGQTKLIIIDVQSVDLPNLPSAADINDNAARHVFQTWLNGVWAAKDRRLQQLRLS